MGLILSTIGHSKLRGGFMGHKMRTALKENLNVMPQLRGLVYALDRLPDQQYEGLMLLLSKAKSQVKMKFKVKLPEFDLMVGDEARGIPAIDFKMLAGFHATQLVDEYFDYHTKLLDLTLLPAFMNKLSKSSPVK